MDPQKYVPNQQNLGNVKESLDQKHLELYHDTKMQTLLSMSLKNQTEDKRDEIVGLSEAINKTKRGASIEYSKNTPKYLLAVDSGDISPYEFTEEEKMLTNNEKEDIKRKTKEYKKLLKRI